MSTDVIGVGWQYPLGVSPSGGIDLASGTRKLEQAMRLILITYPGERPMVPEFGSYLRDFVFSPLASADLAELSTEVHRALTAWESRAVIDDVRSVPVADEIGLVHITIDYTVRATGIEADLVFPFYTIPDAEGV